MIGQQDIDELASYDTLLAYCEHTLGAGHRRGTDLLFMCPYSSHQHPKLSIANKEGAGVFKCRACDIGGNIFALAAHLNGKDKKQDFRELCHLIADTTGTVIRDDEDGDAAKTRRRKPQKPAQRVLTLRALSDAAANAKRREIAFLDETGQQLASDCLRRARGNYGLIKQHADALGITPRHLMLHCLFPERGAIGLTEDGRLCYIYTANDETGKLRAVAVKVRNAPGAPARFQFLAGKRRTLRHRRYRGTALCHHHRGRERRARHRRLAGILPGNLLAGPRTGRGRSHRRRILARRHSQPRNRRVRKCTPLP